jgi:hypothetical protein
VHGSTTLYKNTIENILHQFALFTHLYIRFFFSFIVKTRGPRFYVYGPQGNIVCYSLSFVATVLHETGNSIGRFFNILKSYVGGSI